MKPLLHIIPEFLSDFQIVDWGYTEELKPRTYNEFLKWVDAGMQGPLNYLADHRKDLRATLKSVFPECESALVFLFDYRAAKKYSLGNQDKYKIASYTIGFDDFDYHHWIKDKLEIVGNELKDKLGLDYRISLDIHPVLERDLAQRTGLGWFGKNSMIINREFGSYQLIGSLLLNKKLELATKDIETDHCGTCTRCIDACPTNAIHPTERTVFSDRCISTFTIEMFKEVEPPKGYAKNSHEVFGCDICQEVCPWNRKPLKAVEPIEESQLVDFFNRELELIISDLESMSNKGFKTFFKGTSFERVGKRGLIKNLRPYL